MPTPETPDAATVGPRSRKGAQTRARLLAAAKTVFEETGFLDARISDIAREAGLSHGSFYHYFDSKEQIFREVAEEQEALLTAPTHGPGSDVADGEQGAEDAAGEDDAGDGTAAGADDDAATDTDEDVGDRSPTAEFERIRQANRLYLQRYRDNGKIMGVIEEVSRYDAPVNAARMQRQKHFADRAERAIRRLQEAGEADPAVDPEIAALALGSMVARVAELWVIERWGDYELDVIADQTSLLWAKALGLQVPDPPP